MLTQESARCVVDISRAVENLAQTLRRHPTRYASAAVWLQLIYGAQMQPLIKVGGMDAMQGSRRYVAERISR